MKKTSMRIGAAASIAASLSVCVLFAQEPPQLPSPQPEHQWLEKFVGEWEMTSQAVVEPGQPPMTCTGTLQSRSLGGFWVVSEMKSEMMGTPVSGVQTLGYDAPSKKYVGTWIDSMTSHMWQYEGSVDESGRTLTLEAEGPNFMGDGEITTFRDVYEFKSDDEIAVSSQVRSDDGTWITFMTGMAKRKE